MHKKATEFRSWSGFTNPLVALLMSSCTDAQHDAAPGSSGGMKNGGTFGTVSGGMPGARSGGVLGVVTGGAGPGGVTGGAGVQSGGTGMIPTGGTSTAGGTGSGGSPGAGSPTGGAAGTGAPGAVGTLGEPCTNGTYACAGYAQRQQLACASGVWIANGTCAVGQNCDTRPGANSGVCNPIVAECATKQSLESICNGESRVQCGADLVTSMQVEVCTDSCVAGQCTKCAPLSTRCLRNAVETCDANGVWGAGQTCPDRAPLCGNGACGSPPSCSGLPATCGASGDVNCCATGTVPGGTFNRVNDRFYPATVSDFRLDNYEVTVGRFRKFVAVYTQTMIPAGAGKNTNNPNDPGWDPTWNASLPANASALVTSTNCGAFHTWTNTPGSAENLPLNCVSWFTAEAFCAWDGGRLPTEAEWNYAAAGGSEQRLYPWGMTVPGPDANLAVYGQHYGVFFAPVGSVIAGNGKWGQSDLSGNVDEFMQDWRSVSLPLPCNNCALLSGASNYHVVRGGNWIYGAEFLALDTRSSIASGREPDINGFRCARNR